MLICISAPTIVSTIYMDENICSNREEEDDGDDDDGGEVDINNELTAIIPPAMTIAKLATNSTSFGQAHDAAKWAHNGMRVSTSNLEDSLMANRVTSRPCLFTWRIFRTLWNWKVLIKVPAAYFLLVDCEFGTKVV